MVVDLSGDPLPSFWPIIGASLIGGGGEAESHDAHAGGASREVDESAGAKPSIASVVGLLGTLYFSLLRNHLAGAASIIRALREKSSAPR